MAAELVDLKFSLIRLSDDRHHVLADYKSNRLIKTSLCTMNSTAVYG